MFTGHEAKLPPPPHMSGTHSTPLEVEGRRRKEDRRECLRRKIVVSSKKKVNEAGKDMREKEGRTMSERMTEFLDAKLSRKERVKNKKEEGKGQVGEGCISQAGIWMVLRVTGEKSEKRLGKIL